MEWGGDVRPEGGKGRKKAGTKVLGDAQQSCLGTSALVELRLKWSKTYTHVVTSITAVEPVNQNIPQSGHLANQPEESVQIGEVISGTQMGCLEWPNMSSYREVSSFQCVLIRI